MHKHFIWYALLILYLCHTHVVKMFYLSYHVIFFQKQLASVLYPCPVSVHMLVK